MMLSKLPKYLSRFIVCAFLLGQVIADDVITLEPYEINSSRLSDSLDSSASLIDLSKSNGRDASHFFTGVSGVFLNQTGGVGGSSELIVRGGEPNFTKVYIEGVEVNDSTDSRGGGYQFSQLSPALFGSANLVRGSGSAVFGSDAMSGVLSISLDGLLLGQEGGSLFGSVGSFGFREYGFSYNQLENEYAFAVKAAKVNEDDRFEGSQYENTSAFAKGLFSVTEDDLVRVAIWTGETERSQLPDDSGGPLYAVSKAVDVFESDDLGLSSVWEHQFANGNEWVTTFGFYNIESKMDSPGVAPGDRNPFGIPQNSFDNTFSRLQLDSFLRGTSADLFSWVLGFSTKNEDGESAGTVVLPFATIPTQFDEDRSVFSLYGEGSLQVTENQAVEFALRTDKTDGFDQEWSPSVGYSVFAPDLNSEVFVRYEHGFKVPSFFALYNPMVGNPDLDPESVDSIEAGIQLDLLEDQLSLVVVLFKNDYSDLVDMSEVTQTLVNLSCVEVSGVEAGLQWSVTNALDLTFSATSLNLELDDEGEILRHRPEWMFGVVADWVLSTDWNLRASLQHVGERWDSSIPTGNLVLESYTELDLMLYYAYSDYLNINLGVYNLLDDDSERTIGYESRGMEGRLSIELSF